MVSRSATGIPIAALETLGDEAAGKQRSGRLLVELPVLVEQLREPLEIGGRCGPDA
jgi:hypothetical protein